jgi:hypothetical protein
MSDFGRLDAALTDRYRIERELGAGGMATVYIAEGLRHRRQVGVKVLRPDLAAVGIREPHCGSPDGARRGGSVRLYESPFTDLTPHGPDALFKATEVDELLGTLLAVRATAVAA